MATIQVCDICQHAVRGQMFDLSSRKLNDIRSMKNSNPSNFKYEVCESCNKKVNEYITSITKKPIFK